MTPDRYEKAQQVFLSVCDREPGERNRLLDEACGSDAALRADVERLLAADDQPQGILPSVGIAAGSSAAGLAPGSAEDQPRRGVGERSHPERIGRYVIRSVLGEGGMGIVYRAEQDQPRREVALKVIRPGVSSRQLLRRLEHEAELLGRLQHPGIAQIFEAGTADTGREPQPFFAMELARGQMITDYVRAKSLGTRAQLELVLKVCDAVQHAHQKGIIHRDLKPGNILVDESGQPKILDFGVARATDSDLQTTTLQTDVGQLIGTIPYMSPEQIAGDPAKLDTRSDVYSLGVVCYELLTGQLPHDLSGKTIPEAVRIIGQDEPTPLSSVSRVFRGDLDTIVTKALEKDKSRRYQSASDLAADIERYLNDEPIAARPASTSYQVKKFAKRHQGLVAGAAAAFVVLIGAVVGMTLLTVRALHAEATAKRAMEAETEQRQLAERRFDDVRKLAHTFMFDFHDKIRDLAGSTPAREFLVTTALEYLDKLAAETAADPALERELAAAYLRVGDVQGNPSTGGHLGDTEGAFASYRKALEISASLAAAYPNDLQALQDLSLSHDRVADTWKMRGQIEPALASYRQALEIREGLAAAQPSDMTARRNLSVSFVKIADVLLRMGQAGEAVAHVRKAVAIRESLAADRGNTQARADLGASYSELGFMLAAVGQLEEALASYRQALEILEALSALDPTDAPSRRGVAVCLSGIGDALRATGKLEEALASYREAVEIHASLAAADPANSQAQRDLSLAYLKVGHILSMTGEYDEALAILRESLEISESLAAADPASAPVRRNLAMRHDRIGNVLALTGRNQEALASFRKALEIFEASSAANPSDAEARRDLSTSYYKMGLVHARLGSDTAAVEGQRLPHWHRAREWFERCLDITTDMRERGILLPRDANVPDRLNAEIASCDAAIAELEATAETPTTGPASRPTRPPPAPTNE